MVCPELEVRGDPRAHYEWSVGTHWLSVVASTYYIILSSCCLWPSFNYLPFFDEFSW